MELKPGKKPSTTYKAGREHELLGQDTDAVAASLGAVCLYPKPNEIFVDIDSQESYYEMLVRVNAMNALEDKTSFDIIQMKESVSKSGLPNRHVTLSFFYRYKEGVVPVTLSEPERVLYQIFFCSDQIREMIKTILYICEGKSQSVFFEYKE